MRVLGDATGVAEFIGHAEVRWVARNTALVRRYRDAPLPVGAEFGLTTSNMAKISKIVFDCQDAREQVQSIGRLVIAWLRCWSLTLISLEPAAIYSRTSNYCSAGYSQISLNDLVDASFTWPVGHSVG